MTAKMHRPKSTGTMPLPPRAVAAGHIDWDDLRTILAVAEEGSLAGGARRLGVNHTTALRRIAAAEERLGLRLFERQPGGYVLTAGGEDLVQTARGIDDSVAALERRLAGQDLRLSGTIRLTSTDTLMGSVLPSLLADFHAAHPGILVEVTVSNAMVSLTRREADVAIRPTAQPPDTLVGRRVSDIACAVYAAPAFAGTTLAQYAAAPWLLPDEILAGTTIARWLQQTLPEIQPVARADSFLSLRDLALAGLGLVALPCYLGDTTPGLVRLGSPAPAMQAALWLLTHEDLRRSARIRAFMDFAAQHFTGQRRLLEGRGRKT